jgi:hypothetical protein
MDVDVVCVHVEFPHATHRQTHKSAKITQVCGRAHLVALAERVGQDSEGNQVVNLQTKTRHKSFDAKYLKGTARSKSDVAP